MSLLLLQKTGLATFHTLVPFGIVFIVASRTHRLMTAHIFFLAPRALDFPHSHIFPLLIIGPFLPLITVQVYQGFLNRGYADNFCVADALLSFDGPQP